MEASFNLIKEPWIPCISDEGTLREYGLLETLINAHNLCEIYDPSPLVIISLYRLLLAILHRNFGPATAEDWFAMWSQEHFEPKTLEAYFKKWDDRFDLFSDKHPFYQVARFDKGGRKPIGSLAQEIASGNNPTLFDHTVDEYPQQMSADQAARLLIASQNFSPGGGRPPYGIKEYRKDAPLAGGVVTFIVGENLFQSLMLNLHRYNPDEDEPCPAVKDYEMPAWEKAEPIEPRKAGKKGYLDYLTWQSRCIRLVPVDDTASSVKGLYFAQGLALEDEGKVDPFMAYRKDAKRGWVPLQLLRDRALWRDSTALLQSFERESRPNICDWVADLIDDGHVDPSQYYQIHLFGMHKDRAKIYFWRHERLPLPLAYLEKPELVQQIAEALRIAEETATILRKAELLLVTLVRVPGEKEEKQRRDKSDTIQDLFKSLPGKNIFWAELESPFKLFMAELPRTMSTASDNPFESGRSEAFNTWTTTIEQVARRAFAQDLEGLDRSARSLKAITRAQTDFNIRLFSFLKPWKEVNQDA